MMSWIENLVDIYDANEAQVGKPEVKKDSIITLTPISHIQVNCLLQVNLTRDGKLYSAEVIPRDEQNTIIPATPDSAIRSSKNSPMPIDDTFKYVAKDYFKVSGKEKSSKFHDSYIENQEKFLDFLKNERGTDSKSYQTVKIIHDYLKSNDLIFDLAKKGIFGKNSDLNPNDSKYSIFSGLSSKEKNQIEIYKLAHQGQVFKAYVRFCVEDLRSFDDLETRYRNDLVSDWIAYTLYQLKDQKGVDYISGEKDVAISPTFPRSILKSANQAKLVSGNDTTNFTYLGRFKNYGQAVTLGYEQLQKATLALRWLIERQGLIIDKRHYVTWGKKAVNLSVADNESFFLEESNDLDTAKTDTNEIFAKKINNAFQKGVDELDLRPSDQVHSLILDTSDKSGKGRIDIIDYRDISFGDYLEKLKKWIKNTAVYTNDGNDSKKYHNTNFYLQTYAEFIHGKHVKKAVINKTVTNLSKIILGSQIIPDQLLQSLFSRVVKLMQSGQSFDRELLAAAKLYKANYSNKNDKDSSKINVILNDENSNLGYLYGRLLALAYILEIGVTHSTARVPGSLRLVTDFIQKPLTAWKTIYRKIQPYFSKNERGDGIKRAMNHVLNKIIFNDEEKDCLDNNLVGNGYFLIGFLQQQVDWYHANEESDTDKSKKQKEPSSLNMETNDRDYLFGRLLAVADMAERDVLKKDERTRTTTKALRNISSFELNPAATWKVIYFKLIPYLRRNEYFAKAQNLFAQIGSKFKKSDFALKKRLSGVYLLGYAHQVIAWQSNTFKNNGSDQLDLDLNYEDLSFQFGRLIAFSDILENDIYKRRGEKKLSPTVRRMNIFSLLPVTTWKNIQIKIRGYYRQSNYGLAIRSSINKILKEIDFNSLTDKPLDETFLLGFYQQEKAWYQKKEKK